MRPTFFGRSGRIIHPHAWEHEVFILNGCCFVAGVALGSDLWSEEKNDKTLFQLK